MISSFTLPDENPAIILVDLLADSPLPERPEAAIVVGVANGPVSAAHRQRILAVDAAFASAADPLTARFCAEPSWHVPFLEAFERAPIASLVLARLLRAQSTLGTADALFVESVAYSTLLGGKEFRGWLEAQPQRSLPALRGDPVLLEREGEVLRVILNAPERRNSYRAELRDALWSALDLAERDETIQEVSVSGNGPCFCAGGDLAEFGASTDLAYAHLVRQRAGVAAKLDKLRDRTTITVQGPVTGAGVELAAYGGLIEADPSATFRLPEVSMGLLPGAGGTVSIARRIGRRRTFVWSVIGEMLSAGTACEWGLVDRITTTRP